MPRVKQKFTLVEDSPLLDNNYDSDPKSNLFDLPLVKTNKSKFFLF
jgi:hypothetical protein